MKSILKPNAYIAAQGPNEYTITDFWRLIWEQHSFVIVMLTKVFDFIRVMCCQYWPMEEHKPEMYGPIEVTLLSEEQLADFVIRTMKIRKPGQKCKRKQKKIKLVPKDMAKEANKERLRMLMEDENEVQSSNDRFRESNQSKIFEKNSAECDEDVKSEKSSTQPSTSKTTWLFLRNKNNFLIENREIQYHQTP